MIECSLFILRINMIVSGKTRQENKKMQVEQSYFQLNPK